MKFASVVHVPALAASLLLGNGCAQRHAAYSHDPIPAPKAAAAGPVIVLSARSTPSPAPTLVSARVETTAAAPASRVNPAETLHPIHQSPPPPQVEAVGAPPSSEFVWIPGCWQWRGNWVWVSGRWATRPHPKSIWVPGRWTYRQDGYVWIHGYWRKVST
jgi:hypothetical protein